MTSDIKERILKRITKNVFCEGYIGTAVAREIINEEFARGEGISLPPPARYVGSDMSEGSAVKTASTGTLEAQARALRAHMEYPIAHKHTEEQWIKERAYWIDAVKVVNAASDSTQKDILDYWGSEWKEKMMSDDNQVAADAAYADWRLEEKTSKYRQCLEYVEKNCTDPRIVAHVRLVLK